MGLHLRVENIKKDYCSVTQDRVIHKIEKSAVMPEKGIGWLFFPEFSEAKRALSIHLCPDLR